MRAALFVILAASACYAPRYDGVACGASGFCPDGTTCQADGLCHSGDMDPGDGGAPPDVDPPATTLTAQPPAFQADPSPTLGFTADEPGCTFQCRLDDGAFAACDGTFRPDPPLAEGEHVFEVYATDGAGNVETPPIWVRWTVDLTLPVVSVAGPPPVSGTSATFNFGADEPVDRYECSLDGAEFATCETPAAYADLPAGPHAFRVRAVDRALQTGLAVEHAWQVDPTIFTTSIDVGPGPISGQNVSFEFGSTRVGSTFECSLDPGGPPVYTDCSSPRSYMGLGEGSHTLYVRAENPPGTYANPDSRIWTVDATGPSTSIAGPDAPAPDSDSNDTSLDIRLSCGGETCTYECDLDGGGYAVVADGRCWIDVGEGGHTLTARSTDVWGNTGDTASLSWTTDTTVPTLTATVQFCLTTTSARVNYTATDARGIASRHCKLRRTSSPAMDLFDGNCPSSTHFDATGLVDLKNYTVTITVTDPAGNPTSVTKTIPHDC